MSDKRCWCGGEVGFKEAFSEGSQEKVCLASDFHIWDADGRPHSIQLLYISGPMSGHSDCNYPAFNEAAARLRKLGFSVINPAEQGPRGHYTDILRQDLKDLLKCDGVATLPQWWESNGARTEVQVAGVLKMPVYSVAEWHLLAATSDQNNPLNLCLRSVG